LINAEELMIRHSTVDNCRIDILGVEVLTLDDVIRRPEKEQPVPPLERLLVLPESLVDIGGRVVDSPGES